MTIVTGTLRYNDGQIAPLTRLSWTSPVTVGQDESVYLTEPRYVVTDSSGNFSAEIPPRVYTFTYRTADGPEKFTAQIPDVASVDLWTCITQAPAPVEATQVAQANAAAAAAAQSAADALATAETLDDLAALQARVDAAQTAEDGAQAAQALAEAARDGTIAAAASIGLFSATTMAAAITNGLAAASEGETFQATGGDVDYIESFTDISGVATPFTPPARYPTRAFLNFIEKSNSDFTDAVATIGKGDDGRIPIWIDEDGLTHLIRDFDPITLSVADDFNVAGLTLSDGVGRVALINRFDGGVEIPDLKPSGPIEPTVRRPRVHKTVIADINHVIGKGQSNMARTTGSPAPRDQGDLGLSGGIQITTANTDNTFVPLASLMGATTIPSGVAFAAMQQLKFLIEGDSNYTPDPEYSNDYATLLSTHGFNGSTIAQLSKGGSRGTYEDSIFAVEEVKRIANADGKAGAVSAVIWLGGEADADDETPLATYVTSFNQLTSDYRADIPAVTNQTIDPIFYTYQLSSEQSYSSDTGNPVPSVISRALFEVSEADPEVIIFAPSYWVEFTDLVHFSSRGGMEMGLMGGKVMYKRGYRGEDWRPLEPISVTQLSPRIISVAFNVPEMPLRFDTVTVSDPGDFGFTVEDDDGFVAIADVVILRDTVRITTSADLGDNPKVSYAYYGLGGQGGGPLTGARGCLFDSDPTIGLHGKALANPCCNFIKPVGYVKGA